MEAPVDTATPKLTGLDLVRLTRGLSCVFWGVPMSLLFCIQLLIAHIVVTDPFIRGSLAQLYFVLFFAVLAVACAGTYWLQQVEGIGSDWRRRARVCMASAVSALYFTPFLYWWQNMPEETTYTLNLFGLILSAIVLLGALNALCMELGRFLGDRSLRRESRVFLALIALVLGAPALYAFWWAVASSLREGSNENLGLAFLNIFRLPYHIRLTLFIVLFLPVALTLANLWRVKEMMLEEMKKLTIP